MTGRLLLSLGGMATGSILGIGGLVLLAKQKIVQEGNNIVVELPFGMKLSANYPSLVCSIMGVLLAGFSIYLYFEKPYVHETLIVKGKVTRADRDNHGGMVVGVVPGRYLATTNSDGGFTLEVFKGESSYTGIASYIDGSSHDAHVEGVSIDEAKAIGTLNHVFKRKP